MVFEMNWARVGHPVLIEYSSQEWSSLCVVRVESESGLGSMFCDDRGARNHIWVRVWCNNCGVCEIGDSEDVKVQVRAAP